MNFNIRAIREARNITQAEVCKLANISRQTLIDLESNKDVNTTVSTLQRIAKALNCQIQDLICH